MDDRPLAFLPVSCGSAALTPEPIQLKGRQLDELSTDALRIVLSFLPPSHHLAVVSKRWRFCVCANLKRFTDNQLAKAQCLSKVSTEAVLDSTLERFKYDLPEWFLYRLKADFWIKNHDENWTKHFERVSLWTPGVGFVDRERTNRWQYTGSAAEETGLFPGQILKHRWTVPKWAVESFDRMTESGLGEEGFYEPDAHRYSEPGYRYSDYKLWLTASIERAGGYEDYDAFKQWQGEENMRARNLY